MAFRFFAGSVASTDDGSDLVTANNRDTVTFARTAQYAAMGHLSHVLAIGRGIAATINGELYSGDGPTIYGRFASAYNDFTVGSVGVVSSSAGAAFSIAGLAMTLENDGVISGTTGVLSTVALAAISNFGSISGATGISLAGATANIVNAGHIVGFNYGLTITNGGNGQQITNSGLISGGMGTAVNVKADGDISITNDGIITARDAINLDVFAADDPGQRTIVNTGTITGLRFAVYGSAAADSLFNEGHITGRVEMYGGDDYYDGHSGTSSGIVRGGDGDDTIIGSLSQHNVLAGAAGSDTLTGGSADDLLIGGSEADILDGRDGYDTVSYRDSKVGVIASLANGVNNDQDTFVSIEGLQGSDYNDRLTGGAAAGRLDGGDGNDVLIGGGNERLVGGAGDDNYYPTGKDRIIEAAGAGTDTVFGAGTLPDNVENLIVTSGNPDQYLYSTGNVLNNVITGSAGKDVIDGREGQDTLTGGSAADSFNFSVAPTAANFDTIADFNPAEDFIRLNRPAFGLPSSFSPATISEAAFYVGVSAHDGDDRIIYNAATGNLFFDIDGTGSAAQVPIAHFDGSPTITYSDFFLYG